MIRITWPNGQRLTAEDAVSLIEKIAEKPWNARTARQMREELSRRAYVWSGEIVNPTLPPDDFVVELANAGLFRIEE